MPARLLSVPSVADVGDTLRTWLLIVDNDGVSAAADTVTVALTLPSGGAASGTATAQTTVGLYLLEYDLTLSGRHSTTVTVTSADFGDDVLTFTTDVRPTSGSLPDLQAVKTYLGEDNSYSDEEIADALAAETAAQGRACTIPADYPDDLGQALKRRVARNLAARSVPVAQFTSFEGGGTSSRVPKLDAEIARFEGPFLRWVIA